MKTKVYTTIDRGARGWPSGPWDGEPDKVQWLDEATGLPCLAVRNRGYGNWCGYVGVAEGHPWHGKGYDACEPWPDVHGGLTYSDECQPSEDESQGVCHVPEPGEPAHVWWLGFDCGHSGDSAPGMLMLLSYGTYKPLTYVSRECAKLAAQVLAARTSE